MQTTERIDQTRTDPKRTEPRRVDRGHNSESRAQFPTLSSLYFAYGSNLNQEQMLQRCPTAEPVGPLVLPDWQLEFRGVADIVPCPGAEVVGALYRVWEQDELALDRYEGYRHRDPDAGLYRKVFRQLQDTEGRIARFMFYVMNQDGLYPPQRYYLETIEQGYADWHLPTDTLAAAVQRSQTVRSHRGWESDQDETYGTEADDFLTGDLFGEDYSDV